jgi:hypothetical protein
MAQRLDRRLTRAFKLAATPIQEVAKETAVNSFEQAKAARITSNTVCGLPKEPKSIDDDDATSSKEVSMSQEACQAPAL